MRIIGGPEIYVKSDNRLNLRCRVTKCIEPPELVEWYKDSRRISVTSSRLRIVYDKRLSDDGSATSTLEISKAVKSDSGLYSCKPSHLESSNVTVTVVNGTGPSEFSLSYLASRWPISPQETPIPPSPNPSFIFTEKRRGNANALLSLDGANFALFPVTCIPRFFFFIYLEGSRGGFFLDVARWGQEMNEALFPPRARRDPYLRSVYAPLLDYNDEYKEGHIYTMTFTGNKLGKTSPPSW